MFQPATVPNSASSGPKTAANGQPAKLIPRLELRLEAVGVDPWRLAAGELVAGEPEAVDRLQVVARRDASLGHDAVAQEALVGVAERR